MKKNSKSKKLEIGRSMPPSYHKLPGEEYDVFRSEAVQWLLSAKTGKWQGVDYSKEPKR